jgi:uncharacterized RDD family membrane protein YckC
MTAFGGALTDPTKIMGSRIGAFLLDGVFTIVALGLVFVVVDADKFITQQHATAADAEVVCAAINQPDAEGEARGFCTVSGTTTRVLNGQDLQTVRSHALVVLTLFSFANYVVLTVAAGGTLGKLVFGLRVVTARGQRAGFGRNLARWLLLYVDTACCYLPGLISSSNTKGHRRIGDLAAGTYVVHRSAEGRLLHIPGHLHVKGRDEAIGYGAATGTPTTISAAGSIDAPVFDASRNAYVRFDPASGTWFQWDDRAQAWVPAQQ